MRDPETGDVIRGKDEPYIICSICGDRIYTNDDNAIWIDAPDITMCADCIDTYTKLGGY